MTHSCLNKIWSHLMIFFSNQNIRNVIINEDNAKKIPKTKTFKQKM